MQTYLTRSECAQYLKISTDTLDRLVKRGMPHTKIMGMPRFNLIKIIAWVDAGGADTTRKKRSRPC